MSTSPVRRPHAYASVQQALTQMRFLVVALGLGVLLFTAVATFVGRLANLAADPSRGDMEAIFLAVAAALSVAGLVSSFAIPSLVRRPREGARESLRQRLGKEQSALVVGAALLEATGLFWCVLALMFQTPLYAAGGAVAGALILLRFPTGGGLEERLGSSMADLERRLAAEDREAP
ncbi:MAG: hypothetical protein IPN34_26560 [Planctomycetes bacterium]|nr:hypothetical protein [Planctomycetota bacterium]